MLIKINSKKLSKYYYSFLPPNLSNRPILFILSELGINDLCPRLSHDMQRQTYEKKSNDPYYNIPKRALILTGCSMHTT